MKLILTSALGLALTASGCHAAAPAKAPQKSATRSTPVAAAVEPVTLTARDGVKVYGSYYRAARPKALILLFHQAESSSAEYATIAPRLTAAGYSALAIDQRSGGSMYGPNRTVAALGRSADYLDALPDLQAALDWAGDKRLPVVLWGSSYSSALVFQLAARNPGKARALLAFSPGEYFDDKMFVRRDAAKLDIPVFVTSAPDVEEVALATQVFDAVKAPGKTRYVPKAGVHASSTLIAARNPQGAEANWRPVLAFLARTVS